MNNKKTYTFKPMNFNNYEYEFFDDVDYSNYYTNPHQRTNGNCSCGNSLQKRPCLYFSPQNPCSPQRPCSTPPMQGCCPPQRPCRCAPPQNNFPPFAPPQRICDPCVNPILSPFQDCSKDNFRYFLIGYLFGSKDWDFWWYL